MKRLSLVLMLWSVLAAAGQDEDFLAARDAFRAGDSRRLDTLSARLQGYVLEPYVAYYGMRLRLEQAGPDEVQALLARLADGPLSDLLRAEWLRSLASRRQWDLFVTEYPKLVREDTELTCYALGRRAALGDADALREAYPLWFTGRDLPDACTPLFDALLAAGKLPPAGVWTRIRLALESGNVSVARRAAEYLPAGEQPDVRAFEAARANPYGYLERTHFNLKRRGEREAALFAVARIARTAPQAAAAHWVKLAPRFPEKDRGYVWGLLGQAAAMWHDPSALDWYAQAGELTDVQLAWRVRAALLAQNWREVLAGIAAMSDKEARDPTWRYWKARALKRLGQDAEARAVLTPLAQEFNFYGLLAAEDLGIRTSTPADAYKPPGEEVEAMAALPGLKRAVALYRLGLRVEGTREWVWAIRSLDDRQLLAAAELARRNELWDRAINTAEKTVQLHDFSVRYLAPYRDILSRYADRMQLDEAWLYGLIRQESRFIVNAKSSAGASGLMQLMPATAQWVARKMGLKAYHHAVVNEVETNITLGSYYLKHVLETLDNQPVLASAAYNAGPGRARAWRPADAPVEGAIYSETIPIAETRDYVKKVMANAVFYAHAFGSGVESLKARLGMIQPKSKAIDKPLGDTP